jgi:7-carboxy-7-deazaguanine synthase
MIKISTQNDLETDLSSALEISYPVMEHFYTIQGEGAFTGHAAYFIRLGGCEVGCHWCDVKESWNMNAHPKLKVADLLRFTSQFNGKIVVITGGEPLMHDLTPLTESLQKNEIRTHLETSGAYPLTGKWDWICFSPKKFKEPKAEIFEKANELKIIVYNHSDFQFAEEYEKKVSQHCKLYLQPEWSKRQEITPFMVEYVKSNPKWQISIQTHKYLQIP